MSALNGAAVADLLDRFAQARAGWDGDGWVDLFTPDVKWHADPFARPLVGHNELRAYLLAASEREEQVELTFERHWVVPPTILAAWHRSHVDRRTRERVFIAGFATFDISDDGRIRFARFWPLRRPGESEQGGSR